MLKSVLSVLGVVLVLASATSATAEPAQPELDEARRLVEVELRYREGVDLLERVLADGHLGDHDRLEANRLLAIACVARGTVARAEAAFRTILEIDPGFALDAEVSPKIQEVLERVRAEMERAPKIVEVTATPGAKKVLFAALLRDPERRLVSVDLYTRTGVGRFRASRMERDGDRAQVDIDTSEPEAGAPQDRAPASLLRVEYFVVGRGASGEALARVGDESRPASVFVARPEQLRVLEPLPSTEVAQPEPTPWYAKWWVWAIIAGAAAAGATAAVVISQGGKSSGGTLDPIILE